MTSVVRAARPALLVSLIVVLCAVAGCFAITAASRGDEDSAGLSAGPPQPAASDPAGAGTAAGRVTFYIGADGNHRKSRLIDCISLSCFISLASPIARTISR